MEIALFEPEIPPNTGNISRLCVLTDTRLHIIGKPSFSLDESAVKRAGLDYWDQLDLHLHSDWSFFKTAQKSSQRIFLLSRFAKYNYSDVKFRSDDICVFGSESSGLPQPIIQEIEQDFPEHVLRIPVKAGVRSLNLANAAAIVLYESLRQSNYSGLQQDYTES